MHRPLFFMLLLTLSLSACRRAPETAVPASPEVWTPEVSAAKQTATPPGPEPDDPTSAPGPIPERTRYDFEAVLDYEAHTLAVDAAIAYPNRTGRDLEALVLLVDAARAAGVFKLVELALPDGPAPEKWTLADGVLTIELAGSIPDHTVVELEIAYRIDLPERPGKLGIYDSQLNLGDWYPMFPAHDRTGDWLVHPPAPVGETIAYPLADFELLMEISAAPENLQVAAPAPLSISGNDYRLTAEGYRNISFSMSPWFDVREGMVGEIAVRAYALQGYDASAGAAFGTAVNALEVFSEAFGPYPHASYTIVMGNFPDGLEYDGLTYVSRDYYGWYDGTLQNYLPLLIAHEAAHQWWYGVVGNDPAQEPWLDEALATYSELIYLQALTGDPAAWWWAYRLDEFRPFGGSVADSVYDHDSFRPYVNAVYLRGAEMLGELRAAMGDRVFADALRAYADRYAGEIATGRGFIQVMEEYADADLSLIWERYLEEN